jgi:hypothetical protein
MSKLTIFKIPAYLDISSFVARMREKNVGCGDKIVVKFKHKRRWRLRKVRITDVNSHYCDSCCDHFHILTFQKGEKEYNFDNHFGRSNVAELIQMINCDEAQKAV